MTEEIRYYRVNTFPLIESSQPGTLQLNLL